MSLLNNLYIFVEDESLSHDVESSSHPVEKGVSITDHIQRKPYELSLKGKIVDHDGMNASEIVAKIKELQKSGSLIDYAGRNALSNMQIQSFSTTHPYTNWRGCDFNMSLMEVRIAKPAFDETTINNGGTQQVDEGGSDAVYHTVKNGDCAWNLYTKQYKNVILPDGTRSTMDKCDWLMEHNKNAFSKQGDFRTLQTGRKILVGYKS